ncbi:MAG: YdeI/OmpD-associated family protein [Bacteroidota bacterium]
MLIKYFTRREEFREWLVNHFDREGEIWLLYPKKATGKARILYNDAVEEALCFGWIDSIIKTFDEWHSMQRFSRRRAGSHFSQANKERLRWLYERGLLHPSICDQAKEIVAEPFVFPEDILERVGEDAQAWKHFQHLSDAYKRIRIAYIDSARKRPEEFQKRLQNFISKTRENKLIRGYGGIEKYY